MKKTLPSKALRWDLLSAIEQRLASLRNGRCQRKDFNEIRVSIDKAKQFLWSYPVASDEQVRKWCMDNRADVSRIVPGNSPRTLARLIMEALKPPPKKEGKVIRLNTPQNPAA